MRDVADADRIIVMDQGAVLIEGTPVDVFGHAELLKSVGLDIPAGIGRE
jgi:energy-coupling factor transport system ATP-binding protein